MSQQSQEYYGGFWLRFVAHIIDIFLMWGAGLVINMIMGIKTPEAGQAFAINSDTIFSFLFSMIATSLYYSLVQGHFQGTIGKHLMGLTLVDAKTLKKISIGQSVGRYTMSFISALCFGIGYLTIGWHNKKQGWHDRAAETIVVKKKHLRHLQDLRKKRIEEAKRARAAINSQAA